MAGNSNKGLHRYHVDKIRSLGAEIMPILKYRENPTDHANYIATNNPEVARCLAAYPERFTDLELIAKSRHETMYKGPFIAAKFVDTFDKYEAIGELISEIGTAMTGNPVTFMRDSYATWWAQLIDLIPKTIFTGYYLARVKDAQGKRDWAGVAEFAWREILSLIPVVGPYFDLQNTYINRVSEVYQKDVANRFLASVGMSSNVQTNPNTSLEGILEAEIVEPVATQSTQSTKSQSLVPRTSQVPSTIDSSIQTSKSTKFKYPGHGDPRKRK